MPFIELEYIGDVGLQTDDATGQYFVVELDGADPGPQAPLDGGFSIGVTESGAAVSGSIEGYAPIHVASNGAGGYTLLWENATDPENPLYVSWTLDASGAKVGGGVAVTDLVSLETTFGVDFDGDGDADGITEGVVNPKSELEYIGDVGLQTDDVTGQYFVVELDGADPGPQAPLEGGFSFGVTENGAAVSGSIQGYAPIHVASNGAGGYTLLWENATDPENPLYVSWTLDASGAKVGGGVAVTDLVSLETTFGVDFDGDGDADGITEGVVNPKSELEYIGDVGLQTDDVTGQYFVVELDGADPGPQAPLEGGFSFGVTENGAAVSGSIQGYAPIHVASNGAGGYTLLWENATDPENPLYVSWTLDASGAKVGGGVAVTDLVSLETTFGVDFDGDGDADGITEGVVNPKSELEYIGDVGLQTDDVTGQYFVVELDGADPGPQAPLEGGFSFGVTENGAAVSGSIQGYAPIHVASNGAGGYTLLWENATDPENPLYVSWTLDASGAKVGGGVAVTDLLSLETTFGVDFDGDGDADGITEGVVNPKSELEYIGDVGLQTDDVTGQYFVVELDGADPGPQAPLEGGFSFGVTENGAAVSGSIQGYAPIHVASNGAGGYTLLWENATDPENPLYVSWTLDASGAKVGAGVAVTDLVSLETTFGVDFDGDGDADGITEGVVNPKSELEYIGDVGLQTDDVTGQYFVVELDGADPGPQAPLEGGFSFGVTENGAAVSGSIQGYAPIHVASNGAGGYTLLWENATDPENPLYVSWTLDASGAKVGGGVAVTDLLSLETTFGVDFDGDGDADGITGVPGKSELEYIGDVGLQTDDVTGQYFVVELDGADPGPQAPLEGGFSFGVTENGAAVSGSIQGYAPIHVASNGAGGYTLLWENATDPENPLYVSWTLDASGAKVGAGVAVTDLVSLETTFGVDFDGDGDADGITEGVVNPKSELEYIGDVGLQTDDVTGQYFVVELDGADPGPQAPLEGGFSFGVTENGAAVSGSIQGYAPIHVASNGAGGYTLLWENATDPENPLYVSWTLDASGAKVGGGVAVTDLLSLETTFGVDFDGDGDADGITEPSAFALLQDSETDQYLIVELDNADPPAPLVGGISLGLTDENGDVTGPIAGYLPIAVVSDGASGYTVLWENPTDSENPLYVVWSVNDAGVKVGPAVAVPDPIASGIEIAFGIDLDNDGFLTIEQNGAIEIGVNIESGQFFVGNDVSGVGLFDMLPDPGVPGDPGDLATLDEVSPNVTGIQAEQAADGSYIFLIETDTGYEFTTASDQGLLAAGEPTPIAETDAELLFQLDLDGDGFIFVEDNGAISAKADATTGQFIAVDAGGIETAFTFDATGDAVTQGNTEANLLQIELDGNNDFIVLLETDGLYETQVVDASGVVDAASELTLAVISETDAEVLFNVDLNGDGIFGVA